MTKKNIITGASLIVIFLAVVIVGRLIFEGISNGGNGSQGLSSTNNSANTNGAGNGGANAAAENGNGSTTNSAPVLTPIAVCTNALAQKTAADNTQYATGTILAVFNSDVSLSDASTVLAGYGFSIESGTNPNDTFSSYHLVTATVPAGDEFKAICELEADSHIHSASLNTLFTLHD